MAIWVKSNGKTRLMLLAECVTEWHQHFTTETGRVSENYIGGITWKIVVRSCMKKLGEEFSRWCIKRNETFSCCKNAFQCFEKVNLIFSPKVRAHFSFVLFPPKAEYPKHLWVVCTLCTLLLSNTCLPDQSRFNTLLRWITVCNLNCVFRGSSPFLFLAERKAFASFLIWT